MRARAKVAVGCLFLVGLSPLVKAEEEELDARIVSLDVTVDVERDGSMEVRHKFDLQIDGKEIKRGPCLNFVTAYKGPGGLVLDMDMEFLEVLRDGEPEEHHEEVMYGHRSLFCGSAYTTLEPGIYSYEISYRAEGDWIFRGKNSYGIFDITGPFAGLPIDKVRARVQMPEGVRASQFSASLMGNTGEGSGFVSVDGGDKLVIETTQPLNRHHGVFMNAVWPAGDFAIRSRWGQVIRQHPRIPISVFVGTALLWALVIVLWRAWKRPRPTNAAAQA